MTTDDKKISEQYQQGNKEKPSAQMDDAILKASRDALRKPRLSGSPFSGRWPAVASIAAVLLLTVILVPLVQQEAPQPRPSEDKQAKQILLQKKEDAVGRLEADKVKQRSLAEQPQFNAYKASPQTALPATEPAALESAYEEQPAPMRSTAAPVSSMPALSPLEQEHIKDSSIIAQPRKKLQRSRMETASDAPFAILTPEMWLEKIRQLVEQGDLDYARDELDKFRARYPEEKIEQSLLNKLENNHE